MLTWLQLDLDSAVLAEANVILSAFGLSLRSLQSEITNQIRLRHAHSNKSTWKQRRCLRISFVSLMQTACSAEDNLYLALNFNGRWVAWIWHSSEDTQSRTGRDSRTMRPVGTYDWHRRYRRDCQTNQPHSHFLILWASPGRRFFFVFKRANDLLPMTQKSAYALSVCVCLCVWYSTIP